MEHDYDHLLDDMDMSTNLGGCLSYIIGIVLAVITCAIISLCV